MVKNLNSVYNNNNNNQNNDQVRRLNELFSGIRRPISQNSDKYVDIEILNKNCNLHRGTASIIYTNGQIPQPSSSSSRRGSVGSNLSTNNESLKFNSLPRNRKNLYSTSMYNINGGGGGVNNDIVGDSSYENTRRRQSFNEGYHLGQHGSPQQQQQQSYLSSSAAERFRKRNSYNSLLHKKNIEHPSAFPSLLRTDDGTAASLPRQKESIASQVAAEVIAAAAAKIDHSQYHPTIAGGARRSSINSLNNENTISSNGNTNSKLTAAKRPSFGSTNSGIYTKRDSIGSTPAGSKRNSFDTGNLSRRESRNSVDRTTTDSLSRRESRNSVDRSATGSLSRRESRNSVDRTTTTTGLVGGRESRNSVERIIPITLTGILSQRESRNSVDRTIGSTVGRNDTTGGRISIDRILNNSRANVERNLSRKSSVPRDYVAGGGGIKTTTTKTNGNHSPQPHHSILRKSASPYMDDSDSGGDGKSTLTKENLTRHVRILEDANVLEYNRQRKQSEKSDGLLEEYLKNGNGPRRISIDSLDIRKTSIDITDSDDILAKLSLNNNNKWSKIHSGGTNNLICDNQSTIMTSSENSIRDYYNLPNQQQKNNKFFGRNNIRQITTNDCNNNTNSSNKCNFDIQCSNGGIRKLNTSSNSNSNLNSKKGNCHNYNNTNTNINSISINSSNNIKNKNKKNLSISRSVDDLRLEDNLFSYETSTKFNRYSNNNKNHIKNIIGDIQSQKQSLLSPTQLQQQSSSSSNYHNNNNNNINHQQKYPKQKSSLYQIKNKHYSMDNLLTAVDQHFGITSYQNDVDRPQFVAVTSLDECQAVRCAEFNPNGKLYAVGSNSKTLRICEYPSLSDIREDHTTYQPTILYERQKYHKGSIYCMDWSPDGELIATGSNDKTIKLMRYNSIKNQLEGREIELTMHDGTIRDICFIEDTTNKASLLISGGAGDNKIYVTDCATATPFQSLAGHGGHILSLYNWGGAMFVSGSQDKTIRFWDLRTRQCVNTITPSTSPNLRHGSPVAAVSVDPSGRLLVSGHEDSSVVLYDIRGNRPIQCFKPHTADIRSVRFSPSAYYLLTGGYDKKLVLTDLQGDLTLPLPSVVVAHHADKIISGRWHPTDFSFLSTSADKTAVLWALTSSKP